MCISFDYHYISIFRHLCVTILQYFLCCCFLLNTLTKNYIFDKHSTFTYYLFTICYVLLQLIQLVFTYLIHSFTSSSEFYFANIYEKLHFIYQLFIYLTHWTNYSNVWITIIIALWIVFAQPYCNPWSLLRGTF